VRNRQVGERRGGRVVVSVPSQTQEVIVRKLPIFETRNNRVDITALSLFNLVIAIAPLDNKPVVILT
jgi:hypothetical protein